VGLGGKTAVVVADAIAVNVELASDVKSRIAQALFVI
jgi:hypothetical protein